MEDQYFRDLFTTRWYQLRQHELSNTKLEQVIDSVTEHIDDAQQRNYQRWPILGQYVWPNYNWWGNDYADEVEFFETWLFNRLFWIDNNVPGTLLLPSAEISGYYPELDITLTEDFFSRQILKKKYFTINNAPPGLDIDTVIYQNASQATIQLAGNLIGLPEISITMKAKILNSFEDLTSNTLLLTGTDIIPNTKPEVKVYASAGTIHMECNQPNLLNERMEIFNLSGHLMRTMIIEPKQFNSIYANLPAGIYLCSFVFNGKRQSQLIPIVI